MEAGRRWKTDSERRNDRNEQGLAQEREERKLMVYVIRHRFSLLEDGKSRFISVTTVC